jgi:hypothetical protein
MNWREKPHYIYALVDPNTKALRYVGCTQNIKVRITNHISTAKHYPQSDKDLWIKQLLNQHQKPIVEILAITDFRYGLELERNITRFYALRYDLFNQRNARPWEYSEAYQKERATRFFSRLNSCLNK